MLEKITSRPELKPETEDLTAYKLPEKIFTRAVELGLGHVITDKLAEKLALLSVQTHSPADPTRRQGVKCAKAENEKAKTGGVVLESENSKERSHLSDIFELVRFARFVRKVWDEDETFGGTDALDASLLLEDVGKAQDGAIARLFSLENLNKDSRVGDVVRENFGEDAAYINTENIYQYVREAKSALAEFNGDTKAALEWQSRLPVEITMRDFWDSHTYWSVKMLEDEKEKIKMQWPYKKNAFEEWFSSLLNIVSAHHFLDGNSLVRAEELTENEVAGELLDKLHAYIRRTPEAHEKSTKEKWNMAVRYLERRINSLSAEISAKTKYEQVLEKINTDEVLHLFSEEENMRDLFTSIDTISSLRGSSADETGEAVIEAAIGRLYYKLEHIIRERNIRMDDLYSGTERFLKSGLLVRRENPRSLMRAVLSGEGIAIDIKKNETDNSSIKANAAEASYDGIEIAAQESRSGDAITAMVVFSPNNLNVNRVAPPETKIDPRGTERFSRVRAVSGVIKPDAIIAIIIRFPRKYFPENALTEKEKEVEEKSEYSGKKLPYVYRVIYRKAPDL